VLALGDGGVEAVRTLSSQLATGTKRN
jgi:hypothetical protein